MTEDVFKEKRYEGFINKVNTPIGRGAGLHRHIFACANFGLSAGLSDSEVISTIKAKYPDVREGEVEESVRNAHTTYEHFDESRTYTFKKNDSYKFNLTNNLNETKKDVRFADLLALSPINIDTITNTGLFLEALYDDEEYIFIGDLMADTVQKVKQWKNETTITTFPLFGLNPLTGELGLAKSGKARMRCAESVADYRYCVAEMDTVELDTQLSFWIKIIKKELLPVVSIVYSGNKSLHVVIKVNCKKDLEKWNSEVRDVLYKKCLVIYGCDVSCATIERMSRLPFHPREDGKIQELLYLRKL